MLLESRKIRVKKRALRKISSRSSQFANLPDSMCIALCGV